MRRLWERLQVIPESCPASEPQPSPRFTTSVFSPLLSQPCEAQAGRVPFSIFLPSLCRPYVDLVNLLLACGEEVREAVTHSVQAQCEQNWGSLCSILSFCTSAAQRPPTAPPERPPQAERVKSPRAHHRDAGHHLSEPSSRETGRGARGERGSKSAPSAHAHAHARGRAADRGAQGTSGSSEWEEEPSEYSDIRR